MDSNLEGAMRAASEALLNMAEEAGKLSRDVSELRARVERQDDFNRKMKTIFDEYYGG